MSLPIPITELTDKQLTSAFNRLLRRINKVFAGGTSFGVDLPTLAAVAPELYDEFQAFRNEARRRMVARTA